MSAPRSRILEGTPRLHYLEWNADAHETLILLHGNSANAWWWQPLADAIGGTGPRLLALDLRGHGDSEWVRPPAYSPAHYADDVARFIRAIDTEHPVIAGHSMGGITAIAFAASYPELARAAVAIDVAVTSTQRRNRYLRHLRALPTVVYPDLETAKARFRLMPNEGNIPAPLLAQIAERSVQRTGDGRYTMKFDRESFYGSDGLDVEAVIREVRIPLLLVRAEMSRIMTAEAAMRAAKSNRLRLVTIPASHHHVPLEHPVALARAIAEFVETV